MKKQEQDKEEKPKKIVFNIFDESFEDNGFLKADARLLETLAKQEGIDIRIISNPIGYNYLKEKDKAALEKDKNYDYVNIFVIGDLEKMKVESHQVRKDFRDLMKERYNFINFPYSKIKLKSIVPENETSEEEHFVNEMIAKRNRAEEYLNRLKKCYAFQLAKGIIKENYKISNPKTEEEKKGKKEGIEKLVILHDPNEILKEFS